MRNNRLALIGLVVVMLLGAFLRLNQLHTLERINTYYYAGIIGMVQSPSNFFFAVAEPGASVTIDKPPLGFWVQGIFTLLFGVNEFAVLLPQALAGILSIGVLYHLIKRGFGEWAGVASALALAISPVMVATDRNNTIDSQLILWLLLATWAFIKANDTHRLRYVLWGAVCVGLGFNVKMLQAFMPLPALYALYLVGNVALWKHRLVHLALASVLLVGVSLSWAVVVDLIPAEQRPYVGSSSSNSVLELMIGYNGLNRLTGQVINAGPAPQPSSTPDSASQVPSSPQATSASIRVLYAGNGSQDIGNGGTFRLLQNPLSKESTWLLSVAFLGILGVFVVQKFPLQIRQRRVTLDFSLQQTHALFWGMWLAISIIFFTIARFYHAYYLVMLAVPVSAGVGIAVWVIGQWIARRWLFWGFSGLVVGTTLLIQAFIVFDVGYEKAWLVVASVGALIGLAVSVPRAMRVVGVAGWLLALMLIPFAVSFETHKNENARGALPASYTPTGSLQDMPPQSLIASQMAELDNGQYDLVSYLQERTQSNRFLLAVPSSMRGSSLVIETARPVFFMGGFLGTDPVMTVEKLETLVNSGELSYIVGGAENEMQRPEVEAWLKENCTVDDATALSGGSEKPYQIVGSARVPVPPIGGQPPLGNPPAGGMTQPPNIPPQPSGGLGGAAVQTLGMTSSASVYYQCLPKK